MLCNRCKKNVAVVYVTRIEGDKSVHEGICLKCARELGIKPVSDLIAKMGMSEDDISSMNEAITQMTESMRADGEGDEPGGDMQFFGDFFDLPAKLLGSEKREESGDKGERSPKEREASRPEKGDAKGKKGVSKRKNLETFCIDLTERAREGKLDSIVGRGREIDRVIQILCRRQKNNPCLIGEPGVGKTAIAEALALRITEGKVPAKLDGKEVFLLDVTSLVAGTQFRGQFESRIKGLIEEIKKLGNILLVIDEVHTIVGAGDAEGAMNAANILKPALSRGDIQVIGATTLGEYRRFIEKDSALERRFQPIIINEPSIDDSVQMLAGIKKYYEEYHGINIPEGIIRQAVVLSERYITDRYLPDKAIDLLDEASAYLRINSPEAERYERAGMELAEINARIEALESGDDLLKNESPPPEIFHEIADLKVRKYSLEGEREALAARRGEIKLTVNDLAQVIEKWTNIPASNITENEFDKLDGLEARLRGRLIGQDEAVNAVVRAVKRSRTGVAFKRKPVSFIFAGPTGVGKTELVKLLAKDLFDSPESLIRLDMSEFMEKHAVSRIIGAPPGYVGYDEAGQLTEKIRRKPYSVILFDEIEKAHPDVMNILLQILDDGRITDAHGREVNFEDTIIVMTTNAGSNLQLAALGFTESEHKSEQNKTQKALADFLRPEFLNRVDEIVVFKPLDEECFVKIAEIMLSDLKKSLAEKDIVFNYSEGAAAALAKKSYNRKYGARNLRRLIQTDVEDMLANLIIEERGDKSKIMTLGVNCDNNLVVTAV